MGKKITNYLYKRGYFWIMGTIILGLILSPIYTRMNAEKENLNTNINNTSQIESDYISPGMYKIGTDLPSGEYIIIGSGYGELTQDSTGDVGSIITNDNYINSWYITAEDGEYLTFQDGKGYPVEECPTLNISSNTLPEGMYKVGKDFPSGEYKVKAGDNGYMEITTKSRGSMDDLVDSDAFEGEIYITVSDDQYLILKGCTLSL